MKTNLLLLVFFVVLLVAFVILSLLYYSSSNKKILLVENFKLFQISGDLDMPAGGIDNPRYQVVRSDKDNNSLIVYENNHLRDENFGNFKEKTIFLKCKFSDYHYCDFNIFESVDCKESIKISKNNFFSKTSQDESGYLIVTGKCEDQGCSSFVEDCTLMFGYTPNEQ